MANSANPEINKKIATSALGTLVIATVFFYLGDRYAETLVTYPGQIFDHLSDAFLSMWQTIKDAPFAVYKYSRPEYQQPREQDNHIDCTHLRGKDKGV